MNKRRLTAQLLSGVLAAQAFTAATPIAAQGERASDLKPNDSVTQDPAASKFTGMEWSGTDYTVDGKTENYVDTFGVNREDASTMIVPFGTTHPHEKVPLNTRPEKIRTTCRC